MEFYPIDRSILDRITYINYATVESLWYAATICHKNEEQYYSINTFDITKQYHQKGKEIRIDCLKNLQVKVLGYNSKGLHQITDELINIKLCCPKLKFKMIGEINNDGSITFPQTNDPLFLFCIHDSIDIFLTIKINCELEMISGLHIDYTYKHGNITADNKQSIMNYLID